MNSKLWDPEHAIYFDYDLITRQPIHAHVAAGFSPLYAGVPTVEQANQIVAQLNSHGFCRINESCWAVPSFDKEEPGYSPNRYWRGPIWINMNWILYWGLCRYGFHEYADRVKNSMIELPRRARCKVGLASMSTCQQVRRVLEILDLTGEFDFVASRDDVENGKPNPEIYRLVASELDVPPGNCLVIEDSPAGIQAALAAGMKCVAVTTPFTRAAVHAGQLLNPRWIVDDPALLPSVVRQAFAEQEEKA